MTPGIALAAAEHADPWGMGWEALVALGTLILAAFTAVLARFTFGLASRTRELANVGAADQRAQWRPVLLPAGDRLAYEHFSVDGIWYDTTGQVLGISITNAGRGPALHVRVQLELAAAGGGISPNNWSLGALAPGEVQLLRFDNTPLGPQGAQLLLDYRDLADRPHTTACTITWDDAVPRVYDVHTWDNHTATTLGDAIYPQPGLRDVSPKPEAA
ncbi:hypothetical protein [Streptomyces sp. NPDC001820]|uniref:hypothetical protein n=1 Tax=Streptomyces sp. NPDC001820 TaxID=3364613 RepID=UPI00368BB6B8